MNIGNEFMNTLWAIRNWLEPNSMAVYYLNWIPWKILENTSSGKYKIKEWFIRLKVINQFRANWRVCAIWRNYIEHEHTDWGHTHSIHMRWLCVVGNTTEIIFFHQFNWRSTHKKYARDMLIKYLLHRNTNPETKKKSDEFIREMKCYTRIRLLL